MHGVSRTTGSVSLGGSTCGQIMDYWASELERNLLTYLLELPSKTAPSSGVTDRIAELLIQLNEFEENRLHNATHDACERERGSQQTCYTREVWDDNICTGHAADIAVTLLLKVSFSVQLKDSYEQLDFGLKTVPKIVFLATPESLHLSDCTEKRIISFIFSPVEIYLFTVFGYDPADMRTTGECLGGASACQNDIDTAYAMQEPVAHGARGHQGIEIDISCAQTGNLVLIRIPIGGQPADVAEPRQKIEISQKGSSPVALSVSAAPAPYLSKGLHILNREPEKTGVARAPEPEPGCKIILFDTPLEALEHLLRAATVSYFAFLENIWIDLVPVRSGHKGFPEVGSSQFLNQKLINMIAIMTWKTQAFRECFVIESWGFAKLPPFQPDSKISRPINTAFQPPVDAPTSTLIDVWRYAAIFGYIQ
ncbi:hypothetical protein C8J57DRAFT_1255866 [Mycena rebaudengoi]|nr:hypothetical protein C8J57DRAFT_1255866 [Mycena rebaudengoi]